MEVICGDGYVNASTVGPKSVKMVKWEELIDDFKKENNI